MGNKRLRSADKNLQKLLQKEQKAQQKRDEIAAQLQQKKEDREALIQQVANEQATEEDLDGLRGEIAKLEDRLQVQDAVISRINEEVEEAKRGAFQAEQEAKAAEAASYRRRYKELWNELEALLPKLKAAQMKGGTGGGGADLAQRIYLRAMAVQPAVAEANSPASEHLTNQDRDRIKNALAKEEHEASLIEPGTPTNEHMADPARLV
mgnify:CR=1 FL=1